MVMQYLISRNEEYLRHIEKFNVQMAEIVELIKVLEYNISGMQKQLQEFSTESDTQKKEIWFGKQQKEI
jgi:hypothetical protein|tara:strand:- start:1832 stop:2038 length:207 start_codon:yes stop_codon:yes gene_type:complete